MADFNYQEFIKTRNSDPSYSYQMPTMNGQGMSWADFSNKYNQVAAANQLLQNGEIDGTLKRTRDFRMSGGTDNLYNGKYQKANAADWLAIQSLEGGEWWNNLPGQIAGFFGGEQAKEDWTFDASKFDLSNGLDFDDLTQVRNFAASIPGMIPGGVLEGFGKAYEAFTGRPVQENRLTSDGYEIADYELDASQRAAAGLDAAINLGGTFTGGSGRIVGGLMKTGLRQTYKSAEKRASELMASGISKEAAEKTAATEALKKATSQIQKAEKRQDLLEGLSKGWVTRALETGRGGKPLGTATGLLADMGDEAAEEFVQSYADDVRMKNIDDQSFDRALTGAAWGAAGGLLMGGGGRLLSKASSFGKSDVDNQQDPDETEEYTSIKLDNAFQELATTAEQNKDKIEQNENLIKALEDSHQNRTKVAGSTVVTQSKPEASLDWDEYGVGVDTLIQAFERDEKSARRVSSLIGATPEEMRVAIRKYKQNGEDITGFIQSKIDAKINAFGRGSMKSVIGRNPDTKNGGFFLNLTHVFAGKGFSTRPEIPGLVGSDWDSDKCSVYFFDPRNLSPEETADDEFDTALEVRGYPSQILSDPEKLTSKGRAKSNIEWAWAGIGGNTRFNESEMRGILSRYMVKEDGSPDTERISKYIKEFNEISDETDSDEKDAMISDLFSRIIVEQDELFREDSRRGSGHNLVTNILNDMTKSELAFIQEKQATAAKTNAARFATAIGIDENTAEGRARKEEFEKKVEDFERKSFSEYPVTFLGSTNGSTSFASIADAIGFISYLIDKTKKVNPGFRQFGGLRYWINSEPLAKEAIRLLHSVYSDTNVVMEIVREAFKIAAPQENPSYAIETMCDNLLMAELAEAEFFSKSKVSTSEGLQSLLQTFVRTQSKYSRIYNACQIEKTNEGDQPRADSSYRNPLDKKGGKDKFESDFSNEVSLEYSQNPDIWRNFVRIFGDAELGTLFSENIINELGFPANGRMTINEFIDYMETKYSSGNIDMAVASLAERNPDIAKFFKNIMKAKGSEKAAIHKSFEDTIKSVDLSEIKREWEGKREIEESLEQVLTLFDLIYEYVGYENAARLGFVFTPEFFNTKIGKMLLEGPESMMNVIVKATIYAQYMDHIAIINTEENGSVAYNNAIRSIQELGLVSPLHQEISANILLGDYTVFDIATDLKVSLESTRKMFDDIRPFDSKADFVICGLQSDVGRFSLSSISASTKKAQNLSAKMRQLSHEAMKEEIGNLKKRMGELKTSDGKELVRFGRYQMNNVQMSFSEDLAALNIIAATRLENSQVEKATSQEIRKALYTIAEQENDGTLMSILNRVTAYFSGSMNSAAWLGNRDHMLHCIFDPSYSCRVYDPRQGKSVLMTQESLLRDCDVTDFDGVLTDKILFKVMEKYPQVAGYLADPFYKVAKQGNSLNVQTKRSSTITIAYENYHHTFITGGKNGNEGKIDLKEQYIRKIQTIKGWLQTSSQYHKILIAYLSYRDPAIFSGKIDYDRIMRYSREFSDLVAKDILRHLNNESDREAKKARRKAQIQGKVSRDIMGIVSSAVRTQESRWHQKFKKDAISQLIADLATNWFTKNIEKELSDQTGAPTIDFSVLSGLLETSETHGATAPEMTQRIFDLYKIAAFSAARAIKSDSKYQGRVLEAVVDKETLRRNLIEQYENKGLSRDEATTKVDKALEKMDRSVVNIDFSGFRFEDEFFFEEDFNASNEQSLRKKLSKLGYYGEGLEEKISNIKKLQESEKAAEIDRLNNQLIEKTMVSLDQSFSTRNNHNIAGMAEDTTIALDSLYEEMEERALGDDSVIVGAYKLEDLEKAVGVFDKPDFDWGQLRFSDPRAQTIYTITELETPAGGGPVKVGMNGSEQKYSGPLGNLPRSISDENLAFYVYKTADQVEGMRSKSEFSAVRASIDTMDEDGVLVSKIVQLGSQEMLDYITENPSAKIKVYDPEENAHGLATYNQLPSSGQDTTGMFHRLSGIWQRVIQFSMEDLVLKYKKKMDPNGKIISPTKSEQIPSDSKILGEGFSYKQMRKKFRTYRTRFISHLNSEFSEGSLKGLDFKEDQARLMVQSVTPGILIDFSYNVVDQNGTITHEKGQRFLDASLFVGDESEAEDRFNLFIEELAKGHEGFSIVKGEIICCTFAELNARLARAISLKKDSNGKISAEAAQKEALAAMSDWSDHHEYCDGSVSTLMRRVPPVGVSSRFEPIPITSQKTPMQLFRDIEMARREQDTHDLNPEIKGFLDRNSSRKALVNYNSAETLGIKTGSPLLKVWKKDAKDALISNQVRFGGDREEALASGLISGIKETIEEQGIENPERFYGIAILWDDDEASSREALKWQAHGLSNQVYVKEDVFSHWFSPTYRSSKIQEIDINGVKFIPLTTTDRLVCDGLSADIVSSFSGYWSRSSIAMTLVADKTSQIAQDHPAIKSVPDGGVGVSRLVAKDLQAEHAPQIIEYSYEDIFGYGYNSTYNKRFMTKEEAKAIRDQIADFDDETKTWVPKNVEQWGDPGSGKIKPISLETPHTKSLTKANKLGKGPTQVSEDVIVFLNKIINDESLKGEDAAFTGAQDLKANEIMTMMFNGDFFAPVYAPSSGVPTNISIADPDLRNGELIFSYSGTTPIFELESGGVKFSVNAPNESFKGMGFLLDEGFECSSPGVKTRNKLNVGYVVAKQSEDSRAAGAESRLLSDSLYYRMILEENMSLFYDFDGSEYSFKEEIFEGWPPDLQAKFRQGQMNHEDWLRIIDGPGIIHGSDRVSRRKNELVCNVIREILVNHPTVSPEQFFGGFKCKEFTREDGTTYLVREEIPGTGTNGDRDPFPAVMHRAILRNFVGSVDDLLLIFNSVDSSLCQEGIGDSRPRNEYLIGADGTTWVSFGENDPGSAQVIRYGVNASLGVVMDETPDINSSAISDQHIMARGSDIGYDRYSIEREIAANDLIFGNIGDAYSEFIKASKKKASSRRPLRPKFPLPVELDIRSRLPYANKQDIKRYARVTTLDKNTFTKPRDFFDENGKRRSMLEARQHPGDFSTDYQTALDAVNAELVNGGISFHTLDQLLICYKAVTWTEGMDPEKNVWTAPAKRFKKDAGDIAFNLTAEALDKNGGLIITAGSSTAADPEGRYRRPLLPRALAGTIWNKSEALREYWGEDGFYDWVERMKEEQKVADEAIDNIKDKTRRNSLVEMSQAAWYSWGEVSSLHTLTNGAMPPVEARKYNQSLAARFAKEYGWSKKDQELYMQLCDTTDEKIVALRQRYEEINVKRLKYGDDGDEQTRSYTRAEEARDLVNIANAAAETSQVMALLNPLVATGNLVDRALCQSGMRAAIWFGNKLRLGPYKSDRDHIVPKEIASVAVNDPGSAALYQALRDAEYRSLDMPFIMNLVDNGNIDDAISYINERKKAEGGLASKTWGQIKNAAYMSASGANVGTKMQMRLVIDRFVMFVEENPVLAKYWLERNSKKTIEINGEIKQMNFLEELLFSEGFAGLMKECMRNGSGSYSCFMKAMNSAKRGDMAQKNAVGLVLADLCRKLPFGNFFMTTCVSRFPTYSLNVTGRALNYLLPMSSINYAFTHFLGKTDYGKKLGIEETQIHASMKEAMIADICKLGITGTALVLFGLGGAIQPPDDKKKWGNVDEWMVFGTRAGENWYVKDILGMALPMACFWKACSEGWPRFDILMNGLSDFLYSNPVVRCGDVVSWLMNPAEALWTDYEDDIEYFKNAKDGGPSFGKWLQCNAFNVSMNWATQFITPSILTEVYRSSTDLEKSYKRKWATSASGAITEKGQYGKTEMRTYDDAMKHKLTQHNPVLAYLFATLFNEDYLLENMPNTVMYDDFQLEATQGTSISGLSDELKMAKVVDIINVLMGVDDIDSFVKETGFHLDYETLIAVSSQVWDMYHEADEWYNGLQAAGQLNYLTLGNGDWDEGKRIAGELKLERDNIKQFWYDFYNNKLKNSAIGQTITMYNRYNTTYATDVNGEIYATGIYRSPLNVLPFTNAPGTIDNPEGTAGYKNDFATISAVTGQPLDSRALIPIVTEESVLPAFKELSADKNGNSYSQQYLNTYGNGTPSTATSTSYPRSSGGGGGGGGGGGRSYTPSFYAPSVNLPRTNSSRIMNTDRAIKPNYDYLRPDFETKGSREAYRRSDI